MKPKNISINLHFDILKCNPPSEKDIKQERERLSKIFNSNQSKYKAIILLDNIFIFIAIALLVCFIVFFPTGPSYKLLILPLFSLILLITGPFVKSYRNKVEEVEKILQTLQPISSKKELSIPIVKWLIEDDYIKNYCKAVSNLKRDLIIAEYNKMEYFYKNSTQIKSQNQAYEILKSGLF